MKKILISGLAAAMMMGGSAYAVTSSVSISSTSSGVDGNIISADYGTIQSQGTNNSTSTNVLWSELYQSITGPDTRVGGVALSPGATQSFSNSVAAGNFYHHLDPDGAYATGCNGSGYSVY